MRTTNENIIQVTWAGEILFMSILGRVWGLDKLLDKGKGRINVQFKQKFMSTNNFRSYKRGAIVANNESQMVA